jgi:hypothetical protein
MRKGTHLKKIKTKSNVSALAARIGGTQNEPARSRGGQAGNRNAAKSLPWLDSYDLSTPDGIEAFLREAIHQIWTGDLGSRAAGALNSALHLLITEGKLLADLQRRVAELEARESGR